MVSTVLPDPFTKSEPPAADLPPAVIEIRDLHKRFGSAAESPEVLRGVNLSVRRGEVAGLLGRSGAGKSTLIRCINGLERPTSGSVHVDGVDLATLSGAALRAHRRKIGVVFQTFNLLDSRTALDNVALPLELAGKTRKSRRARAAQLLELVGLGDRGAARPSQLSGGQQQRVGIARALAADPAVLLADEATSALDEATAGSVLDLLAKLNRELDVTIVLVTHQLSVLKRLSTSATLLQDGRITGSGALAEVVGDPHSPLGRLLLPALPSVPASEASPAPVDVILLDELARRAFRLDGGDGPLDPIIRELGSEVEILASAHEDIGGRRVARLRLRLPDADARARLTAGLDAAGIDHLDAIERAS